MQPPIPAGTVLQNRYRLLNILGQGGFGRTYLAEDLGRFNERCALKESIPPHESPYLLEKSRELFQREAMTLYQIKHPQVPQFWATFEEDGRLFLVQDYVEGKTYRTLLNERQAQGKAFSEVEVRQMLQQLLPVLAHIHSKRIIHRDISPDNIILRERDYLPVLIDFGVVKELATRFQLSHSMTPVTTVGKLGYAPSEQIHTGRAYPSSDLYSLAVTAVVLLTGRDPIELFDDIQLTWRWHRWVNASNGFAQVLDRMLSYRPGDRYQSAGEVLQALQFLTNPIPYPQPTTPKARSSTQNPSQMQTIAVARRPELIAPNYSRTHQAPRSIPQPTRRSILEEPWAIVLIGLALALLAGVGSWAAVTALLNSRQQPIAVETPTVFENPTIPTPTPTPIPLETPTPTPKIESTSQRLDLPSGGTISKVGNLQENETIDYIIRGEEGQELDTSLNSEGVLMTVLGPDKNPVNNNAKRVLSWKGTLPDTGDYTIQLKPIKGLTESNYQLEISLSTLVTPSPTTDIIPIPVPTPTESPTTDIIPIPVPTPSESPDFPNDQLDIPPLNLPPSEPNEG